MTITAEDTATILYDIQGGVAAAKSRLDYTDEMLTFRKSVEADWEAYQKMHPDAVLDVPEEMASGPFPRPEKKPVETKEREFSAKTRDRMASAGTALPDGSFPIANGSDLANAIQAIGRAKDPAAAKAHIKKRAAALGMTASLPDSWTGTKEASEDAPANSDDGYADTYKKKPRKKKTPMEMAAKEAWGGLSHAERAAILEFGGGHFYGAWHGGTKAAGGGPGPSSNGGTITPSKGQPDTGIMSSGSHLGATFGMNQGGGHHLGAVFGINQKALPPMFPELAGKRGRVAQPGKAQSETERLLGIANSPGITFVGVRGQVMTEAEVDALVAAGLVTKVSEAETQALIDAGVLEMSGGHFYGAWHGGKKSAGGGGSPRAPRLPEHGFHDAPIKGTSMAKSKGGPGFDKKPGSWNRKTRSWNGPKEKWDKSTGSWVKEAQPGDVPVTAWVISTGATNSFTVNSSAGVPALGIKEAVVMLDAAPKPATVMAYNGDFLVIPQYDRQFAQGVMCAECDHPAECYCADCSCDQYGGHTGKVADMPEAMAESAVIEEIVESVGEGLFADAIREVGRRNSAKDTGVLRQILQLVRDLGIEPEETEEPVAEASVDEGSSAEKVVFKEAGALGTHVTLAEASPQFDADTRTVWVTPIKPGWGNARDNNYYPVDTVREATLAGRFNHLKMYKDHPRKSDEKDLPERSVKDWFATTREAEWDATRQRPRVPIKVHDEADFRRMQEAPEQVAFSIIGGGMARPGAVEGRKGRILESIEKVRSVDWVTEAGAGGGIDFAESASSEESTNMAYDGDIDNLTAEELAEANPALYAHLVNIGKALAGEDATEKAAAKAEAKAEKTEAPVEGAKAEAKESADDEPPAWAKGIIERLDRIESSESTAAKAATLDTDKAAAKKVVTETLQESTLTAKAKGVIAARFSEAAVGDGREFADEESVKKAVAKAVAEAEELLGSKPKTGVVGLGEGAAEAPAGDVGVRESVQKSIEDRWGSERIPGPDKTTFTADEVQGGVRTTTVVATEGQTPLSEAGSAAAARLAAHI